MLIVGELINASRQKIRAAIENQDKASIQQLAEEQAANGADYIDVNAGVFVGKEAEYLKWLVTTVQEAVDTPCCIDSPDPGAIEAALSVHRGTPMINSISMEKERHDALMPIIAGSDYKIVALCMGDAGMPETADARVSIAEELVSNLEKNQIPLDNMYVDPLVQPLSTNDNYGTEFLNSIERVKKQFPGIHTVCGLSNISYGLPERMLLNQTFMVMAITKGLDGAIVNPLDKKMMAAIITAETLAGKDEWCAEYLQAYRQKRFEF
ncbi:MAG: methyltetrahydrofolate cobalamin methyltransferase [Deltaproteobacteria bacterium]|jgi:5-methyltetrahydrofolate--homocysteine methyltransferase|nr:methyltetrahydrofolate cobalamin methyltransferase [Deltaproteobacteria bacterium]